MNSEIFLKLKAIILLLWKEFLVVFLKLKTTIRLNGKKYPISLKLKTIVWLGWKEFFVVRYCYSCMNSLDFPRLILLISLSMLLSLFAVGTQHGLLDNFAKVLLGGIPNAGIPMWLSPNITGSPIEQKGLAYLSEKNLVFHPYQVVSPIHLRLPTCKYKENTGSSAGCRIWQSKEDNTKLAKEKEDKGTMPPIIRSIAVFDDDPLWKYASPATDEDKPLQLVLDHTLFRKYFNFTAYHKQMSGILPSSLVKELPEENIFFKLKNKPILWLSVGRSTKTRQLLPFTVNWVDHIPLAGNYALLFPLEIYHSLFLSKKDSIAPGYSPEPSFPARISSVSLSKYEVENNFDQIVDRLKICLEKSDLKDNQNKYYKKVDIEGHGSSKEIAMKSARPRFWVEACVDSIVSMPLCSDSILEKCASISEAKPNVRFKYIRPADGNYSFTVMSKGRNQRYLLFNKLSNGYDRGLVYVKNSNELIKARKTFEEIENSPFYFNKKYSDSLTRFNALGDILQALSANYAVWIFLFIVSLLGIQLSIMINHRKEVFKIYLWKGIEMKYITIMFSLQILVSTIIAMIISVIAIKISSFFLAYSLNDEMEKYKNIFHGEHIDMLRFNYSDYFLVFAFILFTSILWLILWFVILNKSLKKG